jgi:hypothetical protein
MLIMPYYCADYLSKTEREIIRSKMYPHFLLRFTNIIPIIDDIICFGCSGARARNNCDISDITEIIALLYQFDHLCHYYFNFFLLCQLIFLAQFES